MTTRLDADVAIIGGGLVGTSTALALRRHGLSVVLLEKGFCGAQASGVNYGGVRRQGRPVEQLPLSQRAHAVWPRLRDLIGTDGEFLDTGHLKLARSDNDMASLEEYARRVEPLGLALELLGHNQLRERFGWIGSDVVGASFCPGDGHANPRLVAAAFAAAARRAGAQVFENAPVTGVIRDGQGFALEIASGLEVRSRAVVNSAGAWAGAFAAMFAEPVPLRLIYLSIIVTEPMAPVMTVNIGMEGGGIYARQVERGNCVVGGERALPLANADFSRPSSDGVLAIMARASELFPALASGHVIRCWSGTEGEMPDRNPVIGASRTTPGLFHAFGFSGAGFQIAPGVGEAMAELVVSGSSATPIDAFSITRFAEAATTATA